MTKTDMAVASAATLVAAAQCVEAAEAAVGAAGAILYEDRLRDVALSFPLPASYLGSLDGAQVYDYINRTRNPTATILRSDEVNETMAPFVISFSSRGPNPITMDILKTDVSAPGVDIIAAWSEANTASGYPEDPRVVGCRMFDVGCLYDGYFFNVG
ncbi:subtilisin-like protease SBT4.3 [Salvia miltiorrhiza]|uniref:subtilisin-like protease SBT4.3 n=1 Tax=Salvia miltiorrhiza TaxID=226208 RepID=UPI0025AD852F|nr:subtilisin-like protease SBT4.3 [Salvia miltiorrhiza]